MMIEVDKQLLGTVKTGMYAIKSNVENCLGENAVKYVSICNEDGEVE